MPILLDHVRVLPSTDLGPGGSPFTLLAPQPGFALVGVRLRVGDWVDRVEPLFAEMLDDGRLGVEAAGGAAGGEGGLRVEELRAPAGHVVTGLQTRSGSYVDAVRLLVTRWSGGLRASATTWTPWLGGRAGGGVLREARLAVPQGRSVAVGVTGRAGRFVDALSLVSAEVTQLRPSATPVEKSPGRRRRPVAAAR